jgi:hypothetical protein
MYQPINNKNKYPTHRFSSFIDPEFSFNNRVVSSAGNICNDNIFLEPRLTEYLKKKKYYREYNIDPSISLEKEYQITDSDRRLLRSYFSGNRNIYTNEQLEKFEKKKKITNNFPSKSYRDNDPRVKKINKKDNQLPPNLGMFVPDDFTDNTYYQDQPRQIDNILDGRDLAKQTITGFDLNTSSFNPRTDPRMSGVNVAGYENTDQDKYTSQFKIESLEKKRSDKYDKSKKYLDYGLDNLKDNYQEYNKDFGVGSGCSIQPIKDTDYETELIRGMPHHTRKSYGYRNPESHYFSYIDPNFQNADNSVEAWSRGGASTRLDNKSVSSRQYKREIY